MTRLISPEHELPHALWSFFDSYARRHGGLADAGDPGDLRAAARLVFSELPGLADLVLGAEALPAPAGGPGGGAAPSLGAYAPRIEIIQPDILLGTSETLRQFGLLGRTVAPDGTSRGPLSESVYFDTAGCEFIVISGNTGTGKSSTMAVLAENGIVEIANINVLHQPLCVVVIILYNDNHDLLAARAPNSDPRAVRDLMELHRAAPQGIPNLRRLVFQELVDECRAAYPDVPTDAIVFAPGQIGARGWELLLELEEHRGTYYAQQAFGVLSELRGNASIAGVRKAVALRKLQSDVRGRFDQRLNLGARFIKDSAPPQRHIVPGGVVLIEARDPWLTDEERVSVAVVLIEQLVQEARAQGTNLLLCFDEGHTVLGHKRLLRCLEPLIKQRRHFGLSVAIADQDMLRLPVSYLAQASLAIMHASTSEDNLRHHARANPLWDLLDPMRVARQPKGRAYVVASGGRFAPGLEHFMERPRQIDLRQRVSQHGGHTKVVK
jgi:hypothetical protein